MDEAHVATVVGLFLVTAALPVLLRFLLTLITQILWIGFCLALMTVLILFTSYIAKQNLSLQPVQTLVTRFVDSVVRLVHSILQENPFDRHQREEHNHVPNPMAAPPTRGILDYILQYPRNNDQALPPMRDIGQPFQPLDNVQRFPTPMDTSPPALKESESDLLILCNICFDAKKNCVLIPCGHTYCFDCALKLCSSTPREPCPECRQRIEDVNQIFI